MATKSEGDIGVEKTQGVRHQFKELANLDVSKSAHLAGI
jgi:hypothetical protein